MDWHEHVNTLMEGKQVKCRPKGNSMKPRISSGQLITIDPNVTAIRVGDVVSCRVGGKFYVHLVTAIAGGRFQISNNRGHVNGWTKSVYGKVVGVEE